MIRIRKQNNALYRDVCRSMASILTNNDGQHITLYCLLKELCEKWELDLSYDKKNKKLKVYSEDCKGYERMMYIYWILQKSDMMNIINIVALPDAEFEDINASRGCSPGIISGEIAEFFTRNQKITYTDEFIMGLKNYMLSPVLSEAQKQSRYALWVFICTMVTTLISILINFESLKQALCKLFCCS